MQATNERANGIGGVVVVRQRGRVVVVVVVAATTTMAAGASLPPHRKSRADALTALPSVGLRSPSDAAAYSINRNNRAACRIAPVFLVDPSWRGIFPLVQTGLAGRARVEMIHDGQNDE